MLPMDREVLGIRVLTVVLGAPPFLACLWWGGGVWTALVALLAALAAAEAVALAGCRSGEVAATAGQGRGAGGRAGDGTAVAATRVSTAGLAALLVLVLGDLVRIPLLLGITGALLVVMGLDAAFYPGGVRATGMLLAVLYPGLGLGHLVLLRREPQGLGWGLFLLAAVWTSDIAAYFVGLVRGHHRLAPRLSPGKSWEGAAAGLLAAAVAGAAGAGALLGLPAPAGAALAVGTAAAGMAGDLAESALKRAAGRKDSGHLVPGHGGVLDRFDSLAFAAPVLYWWKVLGGM
jgi:phosphatidate cytidylyltransferase